MSTTPTARNTIMDELFLEPAHNVAGISLYPFSAGILTACRKLSLVLFTGTEEQKKQLTADQQQYELLSVLWLMSHKPAEIKEALASGSFREDYLEPFEFRVPLPALKQFAGLLEQMVKNSNAADVETVAKPRDGDSAGPLPPPN